MTHFAQVIENSASWRLCVALALGFLLGIEHERHKSRRTGPAGLRTFTLAAFLGGLAAQSSHSFLIGIAVLFTAAVAVASYWKRRPTQEGISAEIALVIAVVLGVLAQTHPAEAIAAGVVVALVISSRIPLHRFARKWLTEQDIRDALVLSVAALVILPILPDRAIDPFGLVNPFALWRLAVVLMGVSALSYCAMRTIGPRFGLPFSGFAGGLVSSTAVIASLGAQAKKNATLIGPAAAGAAASVLGSLLFLVILVGAADPGILRPLVRPFGVGGALTLTYVTGLSLLVHRNTPYPTGASRAFDIRTAITFVALVAAFSMLSWAILAWFGQAAIFASVTATALIDAHAAAVSVAALVASNKLDAPSGAFAILAGFSVNMIAKAPTAYALGPPGYGIRVTTGLLILIAGLWAGYAWNISLL
jgi:uncharacterized membrane protein (DUF4010 family)